MRLEIPSNPSTGYQWGANISDEEVIELVSEEYVHGESQLTGSGGTTIFVFKALKPGKVCLDFSYERSWEEEVIEKLEYELKVADDLSFSLKSYNGSYPDELIPLPVFE